MGRTLRFVCLCMSVLFWPKARKRLAIAAINIMNFLYFPTRMLPKRKIKQNYGRLLFFATHFQGGHKDKGLQGSRFKGRIAMLPGKT